MYIRYLVLFIVVLSCSVDYITRTNINTAILSMVNGRVVIKNASELLDMCNIPDYKLNQSGVSVVNNNDNAPKYDWDEPEQGIILGSFFYAYVLIQIPSARLAEEFGSKWIIAVAMLGSGIINLITPLITFNVPLLVLSRIILSIVQGGVFPASYNLVCKWLPKSEQSFAFGALDTGATLGIIIAGPLTSYLSESSGGWPWAFYASGIICLVVFIFFVLLVTSSPRDSNLVSEEELILIEKTASIQAKTSGKVPWKEILTCKSILVAAACQFTLQWGTQMVTTKLPEYLKDVLHVSVVKNSAISSAMFTACAITLTFCGPLAQFMINKRWLTRVQTRRTWIGLAYVGTAVGFLVLPLLGCNVAMVTLALVLSRAMIGFTAGGQCSFPADLSQNFSATIYSLLNATGMTSGAMAPYIIGVVLANSSDTVQAWHYLFYATGIMTPIAAIIYIIFVSWERQPWDHIEEDVDLKSIS